MTDIVFSIGGQDVTVLQAIAGAAGAGVLLLVLLFVLLGRRNRMHMEDMAERNLDNLRSNFVQQLADRDRRIQALESQLGTQQEANAALREELAAQTATMNEQARQSEESFRRLTSARQQMSDEFKALAGDVLKSHSETFSKQNQEQVDLLLKPLGVKINEFQTGLQKDRAELGERIRNLTETGLVMSQEANNLTRALKSTSHVQGAWGEMVLSSLLERSGLRQGEQFRTQTSHSAEDSSRVRTDVEIILPDGDVIVIDSKVSLTAFVAHVNAADDAERAHHLRAHGQSIRSHIKVLASKDYQRRARSGLDFVFMFIPVEAAFSAALANDPDLLDYAAAQGVQVATPTTLMSALRAVRSVWDLEKRQKNAEEIAERAGLLYDKVFGFLGNLDKLGNSLSKARETFDETRAQLSSGRGNIVGQIEKLRDLGAKTSKQISPDWYDRDPVPGTIEPFRREPDRDEPADADLMEFDEPRLLSGR